MPLDDKEGQFRNNVEFERWWYGSKYAQAAHSSKSDEQIAIDAWQAAWEAATHAALQPDRIDLPAIKEHAPTELTGFGQAEPVAWREFLRDFTQHAVEYNDHTPDSFHKGLVHLANRAHRMLRAAPQPDRVAELERERDTLIRAIADHVTVRTQQSDRIAALAEECERLRNELVAARSALNSHYGRDAALARIDAALAARADVSKTEGGA